MNLHTNLDLTKLEGKRPTQGRENGRIVGLSRGMRGNKRETRRRKTYAGRENWQDSRSFERDEKE